MVATGGCRKEGVARDCGRGRACGTAVDDPGHGQLLLQVEHRGTGPRCLPLAALVRNLLRATAKENSGGTRGSRGRGHKKRGSGRSGRGRDKGGRRKGWGITRRSADGWREGPGGGERRQGQAMAPSSWPCGTRRKEEGRRSLDRTTPRVASGAFSPETSRKGSASAAAYPVAKESAHSLCMKRPPRPPGFACFHGCQSSSSSRSADSSRSPSAPLLCHEHAFPYFPP